MSLDTSLRKIAFDGMMFSVETSSGMESEFWDNFANGRWETTMLRFLHNHVRGGYFLDIGSWIGPISLPMSRLYEKVIAVDPDPIANEVFFRNIAINGITNIKHHACALGDTEKKIEINASQLGSSETNIFDKVGVDRITIQLKRFNQFISQIPDHEKISFIKIDCEGAEFTFLNQVYTYIKDRKIMVCISYHPWVVPKPQYYFTKIYHWLAQLPFKRYYFRRDGSILIKRPYRPIFNLYDKFPLADVIES